MLRQALDRELRELYQEVILDHHKNPRNFRAPPQATHTAEGYNPLCGDHIQVYLTMEGDVIRDVAFRGVGCAISTASASLMTERLAGRTRDEAERLFRQVHDLLTRQSDEETPTRSLGELQVLAGVRRFPVRVKCATLAWHALRTALEGGNEPVSTE